MALSVSPENLHHRLRPPPEPPPPRCRRGISNNILVSGIKNCLIRRAIDSVGGLEKRLIIGELSSVQLSSLTQPFDKLLMSLDNLKVNFWTSKLQFHSRINRMVHICLHVQYLVHICLHVQYLSCRKCEHLNGSTVWMVVACVGVDNI